MADEPTAQQRMIFDYFQAIFAANLKYTAEKWLALAADLTGQDIIAVYADGLSDMNTEGRDLTELWALSKDFLIRIEGFQDAKEMKIQPIPGIQSVSLLDLPAWTREHNHEQRSVEIVMADETITLATKLTNRKYLQAFAAALLQSARPKAAQGSA